MELSELRPKNLELEEKLAKALAENLAARADLELLVTQKMKLQLENADMVQRLHVVEEERQEILEAKEELHERIEEF